MCSKAIPEEDKAGVYDAETLRLATVQRKAARTNAVLRFRNDMKGRLEALGGLDVLFNRVMNSCFDKNQWLYVFELQSAGSQGLSHQRRDRILQELLQPLCDRIAEQTVSRGATVSSTVIEKAPLHFQPRHRVTIAVRRVRIKNDGTVVSGTSSSSSD